MSDLGLRHAVADAVRFRIGANIAMPVGLPILGILLLAVVGPTAGRYYIDVTCGVPPKQFIRGEWFVSIALLTGVAWVICDAAGLGTWTSLWIAFAIGFTLRVLALYRGWEELSPTSQEASINTVMVGPCSAASSATSRYARCEILASWLRTTEDGDRVEATAPTLIPGPGLGCPQPSDDRVALGSRRRRSARPIGSVDGSSRSMLIEV